MESYTYKTYGQVESDAKKFAYFLEKEGLKPGEDVFGIFSANNYEYDVAIIGGYFRNLANSSLYDTLGPQENFQKLNFCSLRFFYRFRKILKRQLNTFAKRLK